MATNQVQFTLNGLGVMVDDFATALFPFVDCRALCFLNAASRQWPEYAMGWHAAYACRFGTPPLQNAQMIAAQGGWKSLYLRSHFFRIQPGLQALGIKRGTRFSSLQMNLGDLSDGESDGEDIRHLKLQLPVGTQTLRAAIIQDDLCGDGWNVPQVECAFDEEHGEVSVIQVYSADLGTLEMEQNQNLVGIRVGITAGELLAITGATIADIVHLGANHCGISFELPMVPNVRFELDDGPPSDLDFGASYGSMEWWEVHLDRRLHCIEVDLRPVPEDVVLE